MVEGYSRCWFVKCCIVSADTVKLEESMIAPVVLPHSISYMQWTFWRPGESVLAAGFYLESGTQFSNLQARKRIPEWAQGWNCEVCSCTTTSEKFKAKNILDGFANEGFKWGSLGIPKRQGMEGGNPDIARIGAESARKRKAARIAAPKEVVPVCDRKQSKP